MSGSVTALLVAVVGVLGTLAATVLTQRYSMRAKQQEIEAQLKQAEVQFKQRSAELTEERWRAALKDRRDCYIALNTAARAFRRAIKNCLFEGLDKMGAELEQARQTFMDQYSEAQIILPEAVRKEARPVYDRLTDAYGEVKKLGDKWPIPIDHPEGEELQSYLNHDVDRAIRQLRNAMRRDLGIDDQDL
jgi:hypothetical protein